MSPRQILLHLEGLQRRIVDDARCDDQLGGWNDDLADRYKYPMRSFAIPNAEAIAPHFKEPRQ